MQSTRILAQYALRPEAATIPAEVRARAVDLLLDQFACQIAGTQMSWSNRIADAIAPLTAPGGSSIILSGTTLAADGAAFINSTYGHSNESDDTHLKSPTHPGAVIIPAAFAVAEERKLSGARLVDSIIIGYEVMLRISQAVSPALMARGHHPPPAVGPFGAAAAVGHLIGADEETLLNSLAIAGSYSAGLLEYTQAGGSVKRLHCAIPAQAGVRAAILAEAGVTGPPSVLEGTRGFGAVFAGTYDQDRLTSGLGTEFMLMETAIKSYSCCYLIHPALDALKVLQSEHNLQRDDIAFIEARTRSQTVVHHVGAIVEPEDVLGAQFSMSFALSLFLTHGGCGFWDFQNADLADPETLDLARRIKLVLADATDTTFATGIELVVTLRDGSQLATTVDHARGEPEVPMSRDDIVEKFVTIAGPVLGEARTASTVEAVLAVDTLDDVSVLGASLRAVPGT